MSNLLSIKVYYTGIKNSVEEIRKFTVEKEPAANYEFLLGKIRHTFSDLLRKEFEIFWQDKEGDFIAISSDVELTLALGTTQDNSFKLYVKVKPAKPKQSAKEHPGVTCDGCEAQIYGARFKCIECFDFDLCASCHQDNEHPSDHEMLCIMEPRPSKLPYYEMFPFSYGCHRGKGRCHQHKQKKAEANSQKNVTNCDEIVHTFASLFGLDPDVVLCSVKNIHQEFQNQTTHEANKDQPGNQCQMFGMDPTIGLQNMHKFFENCSKPETQKNSNGSMKKETKNMQGHEQQPDNSSQDDVIEIKDDVDMEIKQSADNKRNDAVNDKQAQSSHQYQPHDFVQFLGNAFQQFAHQLPQMATQSDASDFKVGENEFSQGKATENKLGNSLRQMESMGFDNEGGWLRQLLISKNGSIDKVLEALNPAH